jgi:hypothetical protein
MPVVLTDQGITFNDGTSTTTRLIPAGTSMLFMQTTSPTGWTKQTTHNDKALRVVSGTAGSGGSTAFTSVFASRSVSGSINQTTLSISQIPAHQHNLSESTAWQTSYPDDSNYSTPRAADANSLGGRSYGEQYLSAKGSGSSHNHGFTGTSIDFSVQYVDSIFANKD